MTSATTNLCIDLLKSLWLINHGTVHPSLALELKKRKKTIKAEQCMYKCTLHVTKPQLHLLKVISLRKHYLAGPMGDQWPPFRNFRGDFFKEGDPRKERLRRSGLK